MHGLVDLRLTFGDRDALGQRLGVEAHVVGPGLGDGDRVLAPLVGHSFGDELAIGRLDDDADVGNAFVDLLTILEELVLNPAAERLAQLVVLGGSATEPASRKAMGTSSMAISPAPPECAAARFPPAMLPAEGTTSGALRPTNGAGKTGT